MLKPGKVEIVPEHKEGYMKETLELLTLYGKLIEKFLNVTSAPHYTIDKPKIEFVYQNKAFKDSIERMKESQQYTDK